ncbi:dual specificity protein phosphatase PHS1, partial [Tanacetum coccineum]
AGDLRLVSKTYPPFEQVVEISLWERLGKAAMLNIESSSFSWEMLSSLHHTEHSSSNEHPEDDTKALKESREFLPKEAAAVIKITSSRMATQSERLGCEFAKWLGVRTRVIHNCSLKWLKIKEAAEKAREIAVSEANEVGEMTCSELQEALELSRSLYLMNYAHGSPLLENSSAFKIQKAAEKTSAALGRILMLDLVIRNEDRLPCRYLQWRGKFYKLIISRQNVNCKSCIRRFFDSAIKRCRPRVIRALQKDRRSTSVNSRMSTDDSNLATKSSDLSNPIESPLSLEKTLKRQVTIDPIITDFDIVAIDSGPTAGKRAHDQESCPKLVELLINRICIKSFTRNNYWETWSSSRSC